MLNGKMVSDMNKEDLVARTEIIYACIGGYVLVNEMFVLDKSIATEVLVINRIKEMEQLGDDVIKTECRKKAIEIGKMVERNYSDTDDNYIRLKLIMLNELRDKMKTV